MPITITTRGYLEVYRDGVFVSRHSVETKAIESALEHAEDHGDGDYEIRFPSKLLSKLTRTIVKDTTAPTAPSGLTATAAGQSTINLAWSASYDVNGVARYDVLRAGSLVNFTNGVTLAYSDTSVAPGTTYSYTVRARDQAGNISADSNLATATTDPAYTAPFWTIPDLVGVDVTLSATPGQVIPLTSYYSAGDGTPYFTITSATNSLGQSVSVTIDPATGAITAPTPVAPATSDSYTLAVDLADTAVPQPGDLPILTLSGGGTGKPWTVGQVFEKGAIPTGQYVSQTGASSFQAEVRNRWSDGSVKFAVLSGVGGDSVQIAKTASAPSGAALTLSAMRVAIGSGSITLGTQTFTLAELVAGTPVKTVYEGPVCSTWIFRQPLTQGTDVSLWLDVKYYANGQCELFPWVENGYMLTASPINWVATTASVVIAGTTVFTHTNLDFKARTRCPLLNTSSVARPSFSYWTGAEPGITPKHDTAYIMRTKLTPNFPFTPTEASYSSQNNLAQTYTPYSLGNTAPNMQSPGGANPIGPMGSWGALWLASNADPRGYRPAMVTALASGTWPTHYRNSEAIVENLTTGAAPLAIPTYGQYPSVYAGAGSVPTIPVAAGGAALQPDVAHQPNFTFAAYLITGRDWFLDEMIFWDYWNFVQTPINPYGSQNFSRNGSDGYFDVLAQTRGKAWGCRTRSLAFTFMPTTHRSFAWVKGSLEKTFARLRAMFVDGTYAPYVATQGVGFKNNLGVLSLYPNGAPLTVGGIQYPNVSPYSINVTNDVGTDAFGWWDAPWQQSFLSIIFSWAADLEMPISSTGQDDLVAIRNFSYLGPVGRGGDGSPGTYNYKRYGCYQVKFLEPKYYRAGIDVFPTEWTANWGEAFTINESWGALSPGTLGPLAPMLPGTAIDYAGGELTADPNSSGCWNNASAVWPHMFALCYAVENGYPGAAEAYARITASSSYTSYAENAYRAYSNYAIGPRT